MNAWHFPPIEDPRGIDEDICFILDDSRTVLLQFEAPFSSLFIPNGLGQPGIEHNIFPEPVLVHRVDYVLLDLISTSIALGPGRVRLEGKDIAVSRYIACYPGIHILKPGTSNLLVLLVEGKILETESPIVLELIGQVQAGESCANAHDSEPARLEGILAGVRSDAHTTRELVGRHNHN